MRRDADWLLDILEAIEKIEARLPKNKEVFFADEMLQVWVVHHLQIIGEAAARLSPEIRNEGSTIPWLDIVGLRNFIVHQYFGIDYHEIWTVVTQELPVLKETVMLLSKKLGE